MCELQTNKICSQTAAPSHYSTTPANTSFCPYCSVINTGLVLKCIFKARCVESTDCSPNSCRVFLEFFVTVCDFYTYNSKSLLKHPLGVLIYSMLLSCHQYFFVKLGTMQCRTLQSYTEPYSISHTLLNNDALLPNKISFSKYQFLSILL